MAKSSSTIFTDLHGKVADIVYQGKQHGAIISRSYVVPLDPASASQLAARAAWTDLAASWATLPIPTLQDWHSAAAQYQRTGRSLFFHLNFLQRYLFRAGLSAYDFITTDAPPPNRPALQITAYTVGAPSPATYLNVTANNISSLRVRMWGVSAGPFTADVNRYYGPFNPAKWRQSSAAWAAGATATRSIPAQYTAVGIWFTRLYTVLELVNSQPRILLGIRRIIRVERTV